VVRGFAAKWDNNEEGRPNEGGDTYRTAGAAIRHIIVSGLASTLTPAYVCR